MITSIGSAGSPAGYSISLTLGTTQTRSVSVMVLPIRLDITPRPPILTLSFQSISSSCQGSCTGTYTGEDYLYVANFDQSRLFGDEEDNEGEIARCALKHGCPSRLLVEE